MLLHHRGAGTDPRTPLPEFLNQEVRGGARETAFLGSPQVLLMLVLVLVQELHGETHRPGGGRAGGAKEAPKSLCRSTSSHLHVLEGRPFKEISKNKNKFLFKDATMETTPRLLPTPKHPLCSVFPPQPTGGAVKTIANTQCGPRDSEREK